MTSCSSTSTLGAPTTRSPSRIIRGPPVVSPRRPCFAYRAAGAGKARPDRPAPPCQGLLRFLPHAVLPRAESGKRTNVRAGSRFPPPPSVSPAMPRGTRPRARSIRWKTSANRNGPIPILRPPRSICPMTSGVGRSSSGGSSLRTWDRARRGISNSLESRLQAVLLEFRLQTVLLESRLQTVLLESHLQAVWNRNSG